MILAGQETDVFTGRLLVYIAVGNTRVPHLFGSFRIFRVQQVTEVVPEYTRIRWKAVSQHLAPGDLICLEPLEEELIELVGVLERTGNSFQRKAIFAKTMV